MAKEYIEREAMIQRFKNTPLFSNFNTGGIFLRDGVIDLVEKQFAADVAPVVRCKDCRYFDVITDCCTNELGMHSCCADGFCSYGERKA